MTKTLDFTEQNWKLILKSALQQKVKHAKYRNYLCSPQLNGPELDLDRSMV